MDYYKFLIAMRNKEEDIPDNDMQYFKERIKQRKRDIATTDEYSNFFYKHHENNPLTLHAEIINAVSHEEDPRYPFISQYRPSNRYVGQVNSRNIGVQQPIFNEDLLNEIKQNNKKVVYSKRK